MSLYGSKGIKENEQSCLSLWRGREIRAELGAAVMLPRQRLSHD